MQRNSNLLIKQARNLGDQTFRMNRANKDGTPKPGWWEPADCKRFGCDQYLLGWITTIDTNTDEGKGHARTIRSIAHRYDFKEVPEMSGIVKFYFKPGQKCFRTHTVPVDRDPRFLHISHGETKEMECEEYFEEWNETVTLIGQAKRGV